MGLDISLKEHPEFSFSYTHNVVPMWKYMTVYDALYNMDGYVACDIVKDLERGLIFGVDNIKYLRTLNPPNGWGDADGAIEWLFRVYKEFSEHSSDTIEVDK